MSTLRVTAGALRGRRVPVPPHGVRPTSERARQAYFNIVGQRIAGARFLDLFAGSGIFSFEAVSRGASSSIAIEEDRKDAAAIERLAAEWKVPVTVIAKDVFAALPHLGARFDLIYADPPYDFGRYEELVEAVATVASERALVAVEHRRDRLKPVLQGAGGSRLLEDRLQPVRETQYGEVSMTFFTR